MFLIEVSKSSIESRGVTQSYVSLIETVNAQVAPIIYRARQAAGLTQKQLADLAGANQPNMARLGR